jgi:putative ATPase
MYAAIADAREVRDDNIPPYLKDNSYGGKEDKANSGQYKYPHNYGGYVEQQYLPDSLKDKIYYTPNDRGYEQEVKEIRKRKGKKN